MQINSNNYKYIFSQYKNREIAKKKLRKMMVLAMKKFNSPKMIINIDNISISVLMKLKNIPIPKNNSTAEDINPTVEVTRNNRACFILIFLLYLIKAISWKEMLFEST